jgi:hypothetical protein
LLCNSRKKNKEEEKKKQKQNKKEKKTLLIIFQNNNIMGSGCSRDPTVNIYDTDKNDSISEEEGNNSSNNNNNNNNSSKEEGTVVVEKNKKIINNKENEENTTKQSSTHNNDTLPLSSSPNENFSLDPPSSLSIDDDLIGDLLSHYKENVDYSLYHILSKCSEIMSPTMSTLSIHTLIDTLCSLISTSTFPSHTSIIHIRTIELIQIGFIAFISKKYIIKEESKVLYKKNINDFKKIVSSAEDKQKDGVKDGIVSLESNQMVGIVPLLQYRLSCCEASLELLEDSYQEDYIGLGLNVLQTAAAFFGVGKDKR